MLNYWDLSEKERAALSESDVEKFIAGELMRKGVLRVLPLELVPEPAMPEPDMLVHVAVAKTSSSYDRRSDVGFRTREAAAAAIAEGHVRLTSEYINGKSIEVANPLVSIDAIQVYSADRMAMARQLIEKAAAASEENGRRRTEHERASKAEREALEGVWADWHSCTAKAVEMTRVESTFREYVETAGDRDVAAQFLTKVFSDSKIEEASKWTGTEMRVLPMEPHMDEESAAAE